MGAFGACEDTQPIGCIMYAVDCLLPSAHNASRCPVSPICRGFRCFVIRSHGGEQGTGYLGA